MQYGKVPYEFQANAFTQGELSVIISAMRQIGWQHHSILENHYLRIEGTNQGCYSYVGKKFLGETLLNLGKVCVYKGIAIHEIIHALGYLHEQQRPDRDSFIRVNYENIDPSEK